MEDYDEVHEEDQRLDKEDEWYDDYRQRVRDYQGEVVDEFSVSRYVVYGIKNGAI